MVLVKKTADGGGAPNLDILAAMLKILEVELTLEETQVKPENGAAFTADPNVNCQIEVLKNLVEPGKDEGQTFYDRFRLKKDKKGEWTFAKYSKLGKLIAVRYGEDWFDDPDAEFEEEDFEGFEFIGRVEPKEDRKGNVLPGSTLNWKGMRRLGGADEREAEQAQA